MNKPTISKNLKQLKKSLNKLELRITSCISNTFMSLTSDGNVIYNVSCGKLGIKGSKKNTPYSIEKLCENIIHFLKDTTVKTLEVYIRGNIAVNFLSKFDGHGFEITSIENLSNPAHNGTRLRREKKK